MALFPGTSQTVGGDTDRVAGDDVESSPLMPNDSVYDALVRVLKTIWTIFTAIIPQRKSQQHLPKSQLRPELGIVTLLHVM